MAESTVYFQVLNENGHNFPTPNIFQYLVTIDLVLMPPVMMTLLVSKSGIAHAYLYKNMLSIEIPKLQ